MKIASLSVDLVRADAAVAEFRVRAALDGRAAGARMTGRVVGPRCTDITTIEISYPLSVVGTDDDMVTLSGVIPEPNLWTPAAPFVYEASVEVRIDGQFADRRSCMLAFRGK